MTSEEEVPLARIMSRAASPGGNREWLSQEDTILLRSLCQAMRNADFKQSKENPWVTATMHPVPTGSSISQAGSVRERDQQAEGRTIVDPSPNDLNVEDTQLDSGRDVRMDAPAPEIGKRVNDTKEAVESRREQEERPVAEQTIAETDAEVDYTARYHKLVDLLTPVLNAGGAVEKEKEKEKEKPDEENVTHKLYKRFKEVNDKLQLLENAISRLGGVGDVLSGIRQLRAALVIALRWDKDVFHDFRWNKFRKDVREGKLDSLEKILAEIRDWPDLQEDDTVFGSGTYLSDLRLLVGRVSESAEAMLKAFDDLGTVNGCQFVSLCTALRAVKNETQAILPQTKRFASSKGLAKYLAVKHISQTSGLRNAMESLSKEITDAINRDISNLRSAEERVTSKYTSMSATAAFFSGITATAIQISAPMTGSALKDAVNTAWFISLVFSVGSVIASLIGLSWLQSRIPMRIKEDKFKRGVILLLRNGPTMLMTAAAATFMIGLALFVNSSNQARSTSIATSFFIAFVSVILIFLAMCFGLLYEKNVLFWSQSRLKADRISPLKLWRTVVRLVGFPERAIDEDPTEDITKEFLHESDSDAERKPSKVQVNLGEFGGHLAVVNFEISSLTIFKDNEDYSPVKITVEPPLGEVNQLLWAPDNKHLLIRTSNSLSLWSEEREASVFKLLFESWAPLQDALWMKDSTTVLAIESGALTPIDINTGKAGEKLPLRGIQVVAAQVLDDSNGDHLICVADVTEEDSAPAVRKLLVIDHSTGNVIYSGARIKTATSSLQISVKDENLTKVLLSFMDGSDPQLWHLKQQSLTLWEVKPKLKYNVGNHPSRSIAYFSGRQNELVVCAVDWRGQYLRASEIWVWSTDDATKIHSINLYGIHSGFPIHIDWKVDDSWTLVLVAAYDGGEVVKGKISFFDSTDENDELVLAKSNVKLLEV